MKMLGPFTETFFCINCLAIKMKTSAEYLEAVILSYRKRGCLLFSPLNENEK